MPRPAAHVTGRPRRDPRCEPIEQLSIDWFVLELAENVLDVKLGDRVVALLHVVDLAVSHRDHAADCELSGFDVPFN